MESFYDYAKIFALMPLPQGNRVQVIASSGGIASLVVDELESLGLTIPRMPADAALELERAYRLAERIFLLIL